jgi:hypothetical protein
MEVKNITKNTQAIIRSIARKTHCDILDNRRLVLNQNPIIYYQPDFVLLKKSSLIVIEIELSTDAIKSVVGDIVRAGMIGAGTFIGVMKDLKKSETVRKYGEIFTGRISEISGMNVFGLSVVDKNFSNALSDILQ